MTPVVLFTMRDLPPSCRPGFATRGPGWVCLTFDPSATLAQGTELAVSALTAEEQQIVRDAFGEPPIGQPVSDLWLEENTRVHLGIIPDCLLTDKARRMKHALERHLLNT